MKYYIEVWGWDAKETYPGGPKIKEYKILQEHSKSCSEENYNAVLAAVVLSVKGFADKVVIYTHDGLLNSDSIEHFSEIKLPALAE